MKLINDCNFKVSLTSLQILQKLIRMKQFGTQQMHNLICTKLIEKLGDSKLAIRQTVNTIIVEHFTLFKQVFWVDYLIGSLSDKNQHIKEEILNIIIQMYKIDIIDYNYQKILLAIIPLLEETKTKIRIKSLECLVAITLRNNAQTCQIFLSQQLSAANYSQYQEKLSTTSLNSLGLLISKEKSPTLTNSKIDTQANSQSYSNGFVL